MKNNILRKSIVVLRDILLPKPIMGGASWALIEKKIKSTEPFMVARFGSAEIQAIVYSLLPFFLKPLAQKWVYRCIGINAGFFPVTENNLNKFGVLMLESMKKVDILASWRIEEVFFQKRLANSSKIRLDALGPIDDPEFWSRALEGKKVLVIHPFADTISEQYMKHRKFIFKNESVLPQFKSLQTIKAVQSIAGNTSGFNDWFEALDYMESQIKKIDFDVALIGCGAYGFPLAAFVKQIGKQAIHLGGALQLYFGVKGKRWDGSSFYNEYWVKPSDSEKPKGLEKVEGGCYW